MHLSPTRKPGYCFAAGGLCIVGAIAFTSEEGRWVGLIGLATGTVLLVAGVYLLFREG